MWMKLLLNKWVLGAGGLALLAFLTWNSGRLSGFESGFGKAEKIYRSQVEQAIKETVSTRDEEWKSDIEAIFGNLNDVLNKNNNTAELERELSKALDRIRNDLEKISGAIPSANLGECNLTPEFDRLLNDRETPANP